MILLHRWSYFFFLGEGADNICLKEVKTDSYEIKRGKVLEAVFDGGGRKLFIYVQKAVAQAPPPKKKKIKKYF